MTLLKPTLGVRRLLVFQGGHAALDLHFHDGVNVIRGRNSSGKTTALDLLAYSLGAEQIRWKPQALQCSQTIIEVSINGSPACLRRDITETVQQPISIFWGPWSSAATAGPQEWELYPFKRSAHRISFSQAIFTALEMPLAQGDGASNLTMHQILRVLYADQPSVHSPIFRMDQFDTALTRETVGSYLAGVFDSELYSAQLRLRDVDTELGKRISELKGIFSVLGKSGQSPDLIPSPLRIAELEESRALASEQLQALKEKRGTSTTSSVNSNNRIDTLRATLNRLRRAESSGKDELASLELSIGDSLLFVQEIESRLQSLEESEGTRGHIESMQFRFCPNCLGELSTPIDGHCHLCTNKLSESSENSQLLRMRNELSIQLKESSALIEKKRIRAEELRRSLPGLAAEIRAAEREYSSASTTWSTDQENEIEDISRKLGVLDEEIRQAHEKQQLAAVISTLQQKKDQLQQELHQLESKIIGLEAMQESRKREVSQEIEKNMIRLLKLDLPLQPEFVDARTVSVDFVSNVVYVNGSKNFSESSAVVLRHIFHLSLLTASTKIEYMRVPRFMILDGIDDGGMEKERSHRLQEIIVNECNDLETNYQLIFATSEINPALENSALVIGKPFSPASRSLDVKDL